MFHPVRILAIVAIFAVVATFLWLRLDDSPARVARPPAPDSTASSATGTSPEPSPSDLPPQIDPTNTDPRFIRFADGSVHLTQSITASKGLHQSADPSADLAIIDQLIGDYRFVYRENPVGTENAEIVAQLLGSNPKKVTFLDSGLAALTAEGELLDRWGSPYIFHPLKADLMDVRSIGPDRKPWTGDDLTLGLGDTEAELQLATP
jgi:hypothetical protein